MTSKEQFSELVEDYMRNSHLFDKGWVYKFNYLKRKLGLCYHNRKVLEFSLPFVEVNTLDLMKNTIIHEVSHALVGPYHKHNHVWKSQCRDLGLMNPTAVCVDPRLNSPVGPYQFTCNCRTYYFYRSNTLNKEFICRTCKVRAKVTKTIDSSLDDFLAKYC